MEHWLILQRKSLSRISTTCQGCRDWLDGAVASEHEWNEIRNSLCTDGPSSTAILDRRLETVAQSEDMSIYRQRLSPTDDPRMLGRIGSYEIVGLLGHGGMGVVFKGLDTSLNRYVAIKIMAPQFAANGAARQRFSREAQAAGAVVHEHVIAIHCVSQWQDTPYLVMPYIRGVSLQKRIDDDGALQLRELLRIGMQVAAGLAAAHEQGLIHRDVKPANILMEAGVDRVVLTDFGLARAVDDIRLTRTDTLIGTPQYMSPEQVNDESLDFRTDLFSLGSVLYEASTGPPRVSGGHQLWRAPQDQRSATDADSRNQSGHSRLVCSNCLTPDGEASQPAPRIRGRSCHAAATVFGPRRTTASDFTACLTYEDRITNKPLFTMENCNVFCISDCSPRCQPVLNAVRS